jgi:hypothetical protein
MGASMKNWLQLLCTVMLVLISLIITSAHPETALAFTPRGGCTGGCPNMLGPGGILYSSSNDYIYNGPLKLVMQSDGNLVIYHNGSAIWATGTNNYVAGATYEAILQTDGNFVLYCYNGIYNRCGNAGDAIWASGTNGKAIDHLLLAVPKTNTAVWADFLLIDPSNHDLKQSCNIYKTSDALSNGPMTGLGQACYPPLAVYPGL